MSVEQIMHELAGNPDYAAVPVLWAWPDGGYCASIALYDRQWAEEQGLLAAELDETEHWDWDVFSGFLQGTVAHGSTPLEAMQRLKEKLESL